MKQLIQNSFNNILEHCTLCPRNCGVNRLQGQTGYCGQTAALFAARASLHMWEEPCISGTEGSGTVFSAVVPSVVSTVKTTISLWERPEKKFLRPD